MLVREIMDYLHDTCSAEVVTRDGESIAAYDGRNSIPESVFDLEVESVYADNSAVVIAVDMTFQDMLYDCASAAEVSYENHHNFSARATINTIEDIIQYCQDKIDEIKSLCDIQ